MANLEKSLSDEDAKERTELTRSHETQGRHRRMCPLQLMSGNISERGAWNYLSLNIIVTLIRLNVAEHHSTSGDSRSKPQCTALPQRHTGWLKLRLNKCPVRKTFFAATFLLRP